MSAAMVVCIGIDSAFRTPEGDDPARAPFRYRQPRGAQATRWRTHVLLRHQGTAPA
jgi:hypothetical protein